MAKRSFRSKKTRAAAALPSGAPGDDAPQPPAGAVPRRPDRVAYFNRELSWLAFNRRVLEQAQKEDNPVLERVKFLAIFSSNLDEFFEIRVAGLIQQVDSGVTEPSIDGLGPREQLRRIHSVVASLLDGPAALLARPADAGAGGGRHPLQDGRPAQRVRTQLGEDLFPRAGLSGADAAGRGPDASVPAARQQDAERRRVARQSRDARSRRLHGHPAGAPHPAAAGQHRTGRPRPAAVHLPERDHQALRQRALPRLPDPRRPRLPRHAQQRSVHRRGGGGEPAQEDRGGTAQPPPRRGGAP